MNNSGNNIIAQVHFAAKAACFLSVFLFCSAEWLFQKRIEVIALAGLSGVWAGMLTILLGIYQHGDKGFGPWQPFAGGLSFVLLQAFGWTVYAVFVVCWLVALVQNSQLGNWVLPVISAFGSAAHLILNQSLDLYELKPLEFASTKTNNGVQKPLVYLSHLLSISGLILFMFADYHPCARHSAVIICGSVGFLASVATSHFVNGWSIKGYHWWQPFQGGVSFVLLQGFGWLTFAIWLDLMLARSPISQMSSGVLTMYGLVAAAGCLVLAASLQYFQPTIDKHHQHNNSNNHQTISFIVIAPEIGMITIMSIGFVVSVVLHGLGESGLPFDTPTLICFALFGLHAAVPFAQLAGKRIFRRFPLWQPFVGGQTFVFMQAFGWLLYGVSIISSVFTVLNSNNASFIVAFRCGGPVVFSHIVIAASLLYYEESTSTATTTTTVTSKEDSFVSKLAVKHSDAILSAILAIIALVSCILLDVVRLNVSRVVNSAAVYSCAVLVSLVGFSLSAFILHCVHGPKNRPGFAYWSPFMGGNAFICHQALGWTLYATSLLLLLSLSARSSLPIGTATLCACSVSLSLLLLGFSYRHYQSDAQNHSNNHASPATDLEKITCVFLNVTSIVCYVLADISLDFPQVSTETRSALLISGKFAGLCGMVICHCFRGPKLHTTWKFFQPFGGGTIFIVMQGIAWSMKAISIVATLALVQFSLFDGIHPYGGIMTAIGVMSATAQAVALCSIDAFTPYSFLQTEGNEAQALSPQLQPASPSVAPSSPTTTTIMVSSPTTTILVAASLPSMEKLQLPPSTIATAASPARTMINTKPIKRSSTATTSSNNRSGRTVSVLLAGSSLALFVVSDYLVLVLGASAPVLPIMCCGFIALLAAIPLTQWIIASGKGFLLVKSAGLQIMSWAVWSAAVLIALVVALQMCTKCGFTTSNSPPIEGMLSSVGVGGVGSQLLLFFAVERELSHSAKSKSKSWLPDDITYLLKTTVSLIKSAASLLRVSFFINLFWFGFMVLPWLFITYWNAYWGLAFLLTYPIYLIPHAGWIWIAFAYPLALYNVQVVPVSILSAYLCWILLSNSLKHHVRGSLISKSFVECNLWKNLADYFRGAVIYDGQAPLDPKSQYILGFHPHGVYAFTAIWCQLIKAWKESVGVKCVLLVATHFFWFPIVREIAMTVGLRPVSKPSFQYALQRGESIMLVPGGMAEMKHTSSKDPAVTIITRHKGFVRMAMEKGVSLVPCYAFGETTIFDWAWPAMQKWSFKVFGIPYPVVNGRWGSQIPNAGPIVVVVGAPIPVAKNVHPCEEEIQAVTREYFMALDALVNKYKDVVADGKYKLTKLKFVPAIN